MPAMQRKNVQIIKNAKMVKIMPAGIEAWVKISKKEALFLNDCTEGRIECHETDGVVFIEYY